jgi:hypothetical protein
MILWKLNEKIKIEENDIIRKLLDGLITYVNVFDKIMFQVFVACFCMNENLLSQWRAYAGKGVGYNIGFKFGTDTKFTHNIDDTSDESYIILRKIIYKTDQQDRIISKTIETIIEEAKRVEKYLSSRGGLPQNWETQAALETVNILFDIIISFKNHVFEEEQEWRLIKVTDRSRPPKQLQFRDINERLTPYLNTIIYEIDGSDYFCPITKLRIGPIIEAENTKENLQLFIKNNSTRSSNIKINPTVISVETAGYVIRS